MPTLWGWGQGLLSWAVLSMLGVCRGSGQWLFAVPSVGGSSLKSWVLQAFLANVTSPCWGRERPWYEVRGGRSTRTCILLPCLAVLLASRR